MPALDSTTERRERNGAENLELISLQVFGFPNRVGLNYVTGADLILSLDGESQQLKQRRIAKYMNKHKFNHRSIYSCLPVYGDDKSQNKMKHFRH